MFDVGFSELLLVAIIALLVLGPERLPETVRTVTLLLGRLRRQFHDLRAEVEREIGAEEIRAQLRNESILEDLRRSRSDLEQTGSELRSSIIEAAAENTANDDTAKSRDT